MMNFPQLDRTELRGKVSSGITLSVTSLSLQKAATGAHQIAVSLCWGGGNHGGLRCLLLKLAPPISSIILKDH